MYTICTIKGNFIWNLPTVFDEVLTKRILYFFGGVSIQKNETHTESTIDFKVQNGQFYVNSLYDMLFFIQKHGTISHCSFYFTEENEHLYHVYTNENNAIVKKRIVFRSEEKPECIIISENKNLNPVLETDRYVFFESYFFQKETKTYHPYISETKENIKFELILMNDTIDVTENRTIQLENIPFPLHTFFMMQGIDYLRKSNKPKESFQNICQHCVHRLKNVTNDQNFCNPCKPKKTTLHK